MGGMARRVNLDALQRGHVELVRVGGVEIPNSQLAVLERTEKHVKFRVTYREIYHSAEFVVGVKHLCNRHNNAARLLRKMQEQETHNAVRQSQTMARAAMLEVKAGDTKAAVTHIASGLHTLSTAVLSTADAHRTSTAMMTERVVASTEESKSKAAASATAAAASATAAASSASHAADSARKSADSERKSASASHDASNSKYKAEEHAGDAEHAAKKARWHEGQARETVEVVQASAARTLQLLNDMSQSAQGLDMDALMVHLRARHEELKLGEQLPICYKPPHKHTYARTRMHTNSFSPPHDHRRVHDLRGGGASIGDHR